MPFVFKRLALFMSIAAVFAADKDAPFRPAAAGSLPHHQTNAQVTIGAEAYDSADTAKAAFGKLNPYEYGIMPVLVVIQNDSNQTIRLDHMKVEYVSPAGRVVATPSRDVRYTRGPDRPTGIPGPTGGIKIPRGKKNPLDAWEIDGRAFSAAMLPAGQSAYGFFYFQTNLQTGSTIYINGITEASTGKELFYFEIPLK